MVGSARDRSPQGGRGTLGFLARSRRASDGGGSFATRWATWSGGGSSWTRYGRLRLTGSSFLEGHQNRQHTRGVSPPWLTSKRCHRGARSRPPRLFPSYPAATLVPAVRVTALSPPIDVAKVGQLADLYERIEGID